VGDPVTSPDMLEGLKGLDSAEPKRVRAPMPALRSSQLISQRDRAYGEQN